MPALWHIVGDGTVQCSSVQCGVCDVMRGVAYGVRCVMWCVVCVVHKVRGELSARSMHSVRGLCSMDSVYSVLRRMRGLRCSQES